MKCTKKMTWLNCCRDWFWSVDREPIFGLQCLAMNLLVMATNLGVNELSWQAVFTGRGRIHRVHRHRHGVEGHWHTSQVTLVFAAIKSYWAGWKLFVKRACFAFAAGEMRIKHVLYISVEIQAVVWIYCGISHVVAFNLYFQIVQQNPMMSFFYMDMNRLRRKPFKE